MLLLQQAVFRRDPSLGRLPSDASGANPFAKHDSFSNLTVVNPNQIIMLCDQLSFKIQNHVYIVLGLSLLGLNLQIKI